MLPVEYQTRGIGIGDVGIITDYGGFEFLFNICASQTDLINPAEMPEGFSPLKPPLEPTDIRGYSEYSTDSYIASALVGTSQRDAESGGLIFEKSASEGAILTMPNGSNSKELGNVVRFRKYASTNAEKWYKYVNEVGGHEARNGDVRLVIGYDSTTAWGMATFANLSEHTRSFRLKFKPIGESSLGRTYGWEYSGIADVRSGPDIREVEKLRDLDHADDRTVYEIQCLFVRTLNITLQDEIWNRLAAECEMSYLDDEAQSSNQHNQSVFGTSNQTLGSAEIGLQRGSSYTTSIIDSLVSPAQRKPSEAVRMSDLTPALNAHPSKLINEFLLREVLIHSFSKEAPPNKLRLQKPNAKMAITGDADWISVLEKSDQVLPSSEILFSRMKAVYDICEEEGVVFLHPKKEAHVNASRAGSSPLESTAGTEVDTKNNLSRIVNSVVSSSLLSSSDAPKPAESENDLQSGAHTVSRRISKWSNVDAVGNRLFLGNILAARSTRILTENHITHILSVCSDPIPAELPESGISHQRINIEDVDYADLLIHLPASCRFIESALASGGAVLVHSVQGLSRSAAVVAAYLMYSRRINSTQALDVVRSARDQIWPNPGFQEQLVLFELCHYTPPRSSAIYVDWSTQLDRRLHAAGLPYGAEPADEGVS